MNNTLESHKFFPYIAWTLIIGFAIFTYTLTLRLQENTVGLSDRVDALEERVNAVEAR